MAAECLGLLGLPMGVPIPPPLEMFNYEDPEMQEVLHCVDPKPIDLERLRELVTIRNEKHRQWGFKLPTALNSLALLEQELRRPAFVLVMRDLVAIASRERIAMGYDIIAAMRQALIWQLRMIDFVDTSSSPCLLISYEKALQFPERAVNALGRWAGLDVTPEAYARAERCISANRESYLDGVRYQCAELSVPPPPKWC
jgi:hypothetical protein